MFDFSFKSTLGHEFEALIDSNNSLDRFKLLSKTPNDPFEYRAGLSTHEYFVRVLNQDLANNAQIFKSKLYIDYNLLYPFNALKSIKAIKNTTPTIKMTKENLEWKVSYAG